MKLYLTTIIAFFVFHSLFAQEVKEVEKESHNREHGFRFLEVYTVLQSRPKVKHGSYIRYDIAVQKSRQPDERITKRTVDSPMLETGTYHQGKMHGTWEYYRQFLVYVPKLDPKRDGVSLRIDQVGERGEFVHGKRTGLWTVYYHNYKEDLNESELSAAIRDNDTKKTIAHAISGLGLRTSKTGHYLDGKRVGNWSYYGPDKTLDHIYNFSAHHVVFDSRFDSLTINKNRDAPIFVGGKFELNRFFEGVSIAWWPRAREAAEGYRVILTVSPTGRVSDVNVVPHKRDLKRAVKRACSLQACAWVPALQNGVAVSSIYTLHFSSRFINE